MDLYPAMSFGIFSICCPSEQKDRNYPKTLPLHKLRFPEATKI